MLYWNITIEDYFLDHLMLLYALVEYFPESMCVDGPTYRNRL
jgi:hypothetical protein